MPSSRDSSNAGKSGSGSSRKLPGSLRSIASQAPKYTHQRQSSSSGRPLRSIAPKPPPPSSADETGENENAETEPTRGEPRGSPSPPPLSFIAWTPHRPPLQPQPAADQADEDEPTIDRPSLGRPSVPLPVRSHPPTRVLPVNDTDPYPSASQQHQQQQAADQAATDQVVLAPIWRPRSFSTTPAPTIAPSLLSLSPQPLQSAPQDGIDRVVLDSQGLPRSQSIQQPSTIAPSLLSLSPQQRRQQLLQSTAQAVIDQVALGRPRSQSNQLPPLLAPSLLCSFPQQQQQQQPPPPPLLAPSLLCSLPQQQQQQPQPQVPCQIPITELTVIPPRPPVFGRGHPRHLRSQSWSARSTRPLRTLRPKPDTSSSSQPERAEPTTHYELLSRRLLSPSRTAVSAPSPVAAPTPSIISPASAPTSKTASPIAQASPPLAVHHPFWGPGAAEVLPCDESGTIRDAYKRARIREVELLQGRARAPYWTVRHIQEVCADVHRMPASARAGFGDLHKQLRELYDFHAHVMGLYAPPWAHPDDVVAVEGAGLETMLPRVLRDFVLGMSEHLLGVWRPFSRERVDWNVHSKHSLLEDFSCFLQFHNKFYGQRVILMQAPAAPGWSEQGSLRFYDSIRFRGYLEREETGLTKYETERKSFVDCFWDT
ncbi:hypothetical protein LEL_02611 [Akanthomyces lecanii RCEF 1005]|uniref:Uncharacterized protein n=1 Tax=Akanthomyces lecanii RCEF 1005 TaxID=1081108 RepID=A0A162IWK1_CORDF|nr:hypothetical protein LEL_02611 [Akanthomyces lecanii RCEF 1005]